MTFTLSNLLELPENALQQAGCGFAACATRANDAGYPQAGVAARALLSWLGPETTAYR